MEAPRRQPDRPPDLAQRKAIERLLAELPEAGAIPRKEGELSFEAPWQIRALALAVAAHYQGRFPWADFQSQLVAAIASYREVERMTEPVLLPVKYPRPSGWRPSPEENPHNAWYWRGEIQGAAEG